MTSDDTVLVIHPSPHREVLIRFEDSGSRVITLDKIVVWMHNYIFRGVRSLIDYSKKCPDVRIICYRFPSFPMKDWGAGEREIKEKELSYGKIRSALKNGQLITRSFDDLHYTNEEQLELFDICDRTYNLGGEYVFKDKQGRLANYANGRRVTIDQPDRHKRSIFIIGPCNIAGLFAPDDKTICSYLQRRFNEDVAELGIIVENCGIYLGNLNDKHKKLSYIFTKPNDIILTDI